MHSKNLASREAQSGWKQEIEEASMKNIYSMIDKQENTIMHLLNKYSDGAVNEEWRQREGRRDTQDNVEGVSSLPSSSRLQKVSRSKRSDTQLSVLSKREQHS